MVERTLVTGGAGFIGSFVVEELLRRGQRVTVLDNYRSGSPANLEAAKKLGGLQVIEGDIRSASALDKALKGVSAVYHLAVEPLTIGLEDPFLIDSVNSTGTLATLYAAHRAGVQRFNYISSSEVYGTFMHFPMNEDHPRLPRTVYAASKLAGEAYTLSYSNCYGLPYSIIRPFNAYGPRHRDDGYCAVIFKFLQNLSRGKPPVIYGDGKQTRDMSYVEDTARGIVMAGESPKMVNETVNIGTGREVSVNEVADAVMDAYGKRFQPVHEAERPGDVRRHLAGIAKAQKLFGYKPEHSFEDGVKKTVEWYKKTHR